MLSKADLTRKIILEIEGGYLKEAGNGMTPDFICTGLTDEPLNKEEFLDLFQHLINAMPDLAFNLTNVEEDGDLVHTEIQLTATQMNPLDLPAFGITGVPATRRSVELTREPAEIKFSDRKIARMRILPAAGGTLKDMLKQLQVEAPEPAGV